MSRGSSPPGNPDASRSHHRLRKGLILAAAFVVLLLVLARWVVSPIVTQAVNRKLAQLDGFHGRVETVKLALWRGAVEADQFRLFETGKEQQGPVVQFEEVELRLAWLALFRGRLGGAMTIERPRVEIRKTERATEENQQEAVAKLKTLQAKMDPWQKALRNSVPMELTRLEVNRGSIQFQDTSHQPPAEFSLDGIHLVATGLRNRRKGEKYPARLELHATTSGNGRLDATVKADPLAEAPSFETTLQIQHLDLTGLNGFLAAYSEVKVTQGTFEFYLEAAAAGGQYHGYVKPFFKDLEFESTKDSLGSKLKEAAADVANAILQNDKDQKVATKAPFSGSFSNNDVDVWTAVDLLLRNAFVQALHEGFDR